MIGDGEQEEIAVPGIKMSQRTLGQHRHSEALVARGVDQPFAGQPMQRVTHRSDARVQLVRQYRRFEPVAGTKQAAAKLLLDCRVDALEGARPAHRPPSAGRPLRRPIPLPHIVGEKFL